MSNSGFTDTVIMRGLTKPTLIVARSFMFMILYYIMFQILYICNVIYTVDTTGWQTLGILFAIAQGLYQGWGEALVYSNPKFIVLRVALCGA